MIDSVSRWLKSITEVALVVIALGVVLQILFPKALVFISADVTGNLIGLIDEFSGAGLVGLIAAWIVMYLIQKR